jgi:hypothetical protein
MHMANEKQPARPAHLLGLWPPRGWAYDYTVKDSDNWWTLAAKFSMNDEWELIEYNFRTRVPEEVNWYLREYLGCRTETPDKNNYRFFGADPTKRKIYIPPGPGPRRDRAIFTEVIENLKKEIPINDPRRSTYMCILSKLVGDGMSNVDDRVIFWNDILPEPFASTPPGVRRRGHKQLSRGVTQDWLHTNIRNWQMVDAQPAREGLVGFGMFVTSLRKALYVPVETKLVGLRGMVNEILETHEFLDQWANMPLGGSSAMPTEYRAIKDWVWRQENQSHAVLSCVKPRR